MKKRIILLHSHIFKNAGSTIDAILKKNFNSCATFAESMDGQFISNEKIINSCLSNENIVSISSHKIRVPTVTHPDLHFISLVMLRNPLDRLGSIYSFYRRQESSVLQHECKLAQLLPFRDFVKVLIESGNDSSFANLQTKFFLNQGLGLSEETWPIAVMNFQEAICVGVVDKFNESIALWSKYLAHYFPAIDLSYQKMNTSVNRAATIEARITVLEEALGEELLDIFRKRNRFDYQLYGLASDRIERGSQTATVSLLQKNQTPSFIDDEAEVDACQVEPGRALTVELNLPSGPPLCCDKDGVKLIVPHASRNNEVPELGAEIIGCGLFDANNNPVYIVKQGQSVMVLLAITIKKNIIKPILGITVKDRLDNIIFGINTNYSSNKIEVLSGNCTNFYCFQFVVPPLNQGSYSITPAIAAGTQEHHIVIDIVDAAVLFFIPAMITPRLPGVLCIQDFRFSSHIGVT